MLLNCRRRRGGAKGRGCFSGQFLSKLVSKMTGLLDNRAMVTQQF